MTNYQLPSWPGWETTRLIGCGSYGAVYEIERDILGSVEKAALKVISIPQNAGDIDEMYGDGYDEESITSTFKSHLKSIVAEYSMMRKMNGSANIVNCDDVRYVQHDDGIGWDIFIKMELLTPLTEALTVEVSEETVLNIAKDICSALVLCKKHEIVHRDIKPQNIFLSPNGDYKLGDFGIAKTVEKTMGGTKIGTYKYMAPEVYNNHPYGSGADIYSLGLVLYWLLNERRMPFMPLPPAKLKEGLDEDARHRRLSGEKLPAPAHGSNELKRIVLKACAYDPKDRYSSATEMLNDLNALAYGTFLPDVVEDDKNAVMQEEELTVGPSFNDSKKRLVGVHEDQELNGTVGPVFAKKVNQPQVQTEKQHNKGTSAKSDNGSSKKKKKVGLIAALCATIAVIFLLLQQCGGYSRPVQGEWSEWMDTIPSYVTAENYIIEEQVLYRSRTQETTESTTEKEMPGWELYSTASGGEDFGEWSDWSATEVVGSDTREVESELRYRYRDKITTTGSSSDMGGWTLYDTTYTWGDYGEWSKWSTTVATESESRMVETKPQYCYRDISYTTEYTQWGEWSAWSFVRQDTNDLKMEESRTVWGYYYYSCPSCGAHMHGWNIYCPTWAGGCGNGWISEDRCTVVYSTTSWDAAGLSDWYGTGKYYAYVDGQLVFKWTSGGSGTQYRYCTRSTQQVVNYGSWSEWGDTAYYNSSNREVQTRTVYRYCDRSQVPTYHFWKWGDWSEWSVTAVSGTDSREFETATFYRYRDIVEETVYYFRRWSEWSEYTSEEIVGTDTIEVEEKIQYRYKQK